MAGEVVATGEDVEKWSIGDRVCANFTQDHVFGDLNPKIQNTALGGSLDGVLTEYEVFPSEVCSTSITCRSCLSVRTGFGSSARTFIVRGSLYPTVCALYIIDVVE